METIQFTYPFPLELEIDLINFTMEHMYMNKKECDNDIIIHKFISTPEKTGLDLSQYDYSEIIHQLKEYYFKRLLKIIKIIFIDYDSNNQSISSLNFTSVHERCFQDEKYCVISVTDFTNPPCFVKSNIYEQVHGLLINSKNYDVLTKCNKLQYVNSMCAITDISYCTYLDLSNLTTIISPLTSNNCNVIKKFTQIKELTLRHEYSAPSHFLHNCYNDLVDVLYCVKDNLTTLNLRVNVASQYVNQTLSLLDIFTHNTTITDLTYDTKCHTQTEPLYNSKVTMAVNNLITKNTTLTNLKLQKSPHTYNLKILNSLKNNTLLTKLHIRYNNYNPIYVRFGDSDNSDPDLTKFEDLVRTTIINFIEYRYENLPNINFNLSSINLSLALELINKYYYIENLDCFIKHLYSVNNNIRTYLYNYKKYNLSLMKRCQC